MVGFPAVHIAGTKGKGSTAAFLSNIMREQGYNAGCYSRCLLLSRFFYSHEKMLTLPSLKLDMDLSQLQNT
ncbi:unnamed protein product [Urochloa humidicola]